MTKIKVKCRIKGKSWVLNLEKESLGRRYWWCSWEISWVINCDVLKMDIIFTYNCYWLTACWRKIRSTRNSASPSPKYSIGPPKMLATMPLSSSSTPNRSTGHPSSRNLLQAPLSPTPCSSMPTSRSLTRRRKKLYFWPYHVGYHENVQSRESSWAVHHRPRVPEREKSAILYFRQQPSPPSQRLYP